MPQALKETWLGSALSRVPASLQLCLSLWDLLLISEDRRRKENSGNGRSYLPQNGEVTEQLDLYRNSAALIPGLNSLTHNTQNFFLSIEE